ncbi:hypothetical protein ACTFIR_007606 [Dictyostelium discoideum]
MFLRLSLKTIKKCQSNFITSFNSKQYKFFTTHYGYDFFNNDENDSGGGGGGEYQTSFDYDVDIEVPILSNVTTSNTTIINRPFYNNNNNLQVSSLTAEKLPKKIKINKKPLVNNNNNVNLTKTTKSTNTSTTQSQPNDQGLFPPTKTKNKTSSVNEKEEIEILNNFAKSLQDQQQKVKTIFDKFENIENDNSDNVDSQNLLELDELLTSEQQKIVNLIVDGGKNVFFTGSAGTGKSFVLKHLVSKLRKKYPKSVYVTAATGIAAVNIGGTTLHSFAGIKLGVAPAQRLAVEILQSKKLLQKWLDCSVLIIDEISMIDAELFEKLDTIGQMVRGNNQPFGGIQLVLVGDFFQLPPVHGNYAFECKAWKKSIDISVELTTVMRQKETEFIDILNKIRVGDIKEDMINRLVSTCNKPLDISNGILPTRLYSTNASVDQENQSSLDKLLGEPFSFQAVDSGNKELIELLDRDCPAMKNLTLKVGAQVVLLRKIEKGDGLVNGSRGVVVDFVKARVSRKNNKFHKVNQYLPVVLFNDGQKVTIPPSEWCVWSEEKAYRNQIPLKLAWALTIHRAQGMTLDKVECELSRTFASGQGYVALSRVKSLAGLHLKSLNTPALKTSPKVVTFNKKIIRSINNSHI